MAKNLDEFIDLETWCEEYGFQVKNILKVFKKKKVYPAKIGSRVMVKENDIKLFLKEEINIKTVANTVRAGKASERAKRQRDIYQTVQRICRDNGMDDFSEIIENVEIGVNTQVNSYLIVKAEQNKQTAEIESKRLRDLTENQSSNKTEGSKGSGQSGGSATSP